MATYAIGDVHGCRVALDALLEVVAPTRQDHIVFLGDYVDRGPDSRGVIDRVLALRQTHQVVTLVGNHELMMRDARTDWHGERAWRSVGGQQALASYGGSSLELVPEEHWAFLDSLQPYLELDRHICVHASYTPHLPMAAQTPLMLCWERLSYDHAPHVSGKRVICGHTRQEEGLPLDLGHQVCIDTSCYAGGWLTCLDIETGAFWQADEAARTRTGSLGQLALGRWPS